MKIIKIYVFSIVFILILSLNITYAYQSNIVRLNRLSQNFYSENALFFAISENNLTYKRLKEIMPPNSVFYANFISNNDVRGITFTGKCEGPELEDGRFFSEEDFESASTKLAVVGNKVETFSKGNQTFVGWNGIEYEVIGIIGYGFPTRLDFTIMLSLNEDLIQNEAHRYIIDSSNLQANFDFLGYDNYLGQVIVHSSDALNLLNIIDKDNKQFVLYCLSIFLFFTNSLIIILFLIDKMTYEIKVKKFIGYSDSELILDIHRNVFCLLFISIVFGAFVSAAYTAYKYNSFSIILMVVNICIAAVLFLYVHILVRRKLRNLTSLRLGEEN